jgi:hypothetical protein
MLIKKGPKKKKEHYSSTGNDEFKTHKHILARG